MRKTSLEQGGDVPGARRRWPWSREMSLEHCKGRSCSLGMEEGKDPPPPNGFLQIKEPQLPFFPVMAPEANVLKRKQKDCFTSHKWGRSSVGTEALE